MFVLVANQGKDNEQFAVPTWADHCSGPAMSLVNTIKELPTKGFFHTKEAAEAFLAHYKRCIGYEPLVDIKEVEVTN